MILDKIQDALAIPTNWIKPIFNLQWGWGTLKIPNPLNIRIQFFQDTPSLYMNGLIFIGLQAPFFINFQIRIGAYTLQTHLGWRPVDGLPVAVFRIQTDDTRQGGLARGYEDGSL